MTSTLTINNDFYNMFQVAPPVTDQDILDAVDKLVPSGVDTLTMDLPPHPGGGILDPAVQALYAHPEEDPCLGNLAAFLAAGKDPYAMVLERARRKGLAFHASLRMNDTHYKDQPFHPWVDAFYYDHLADRIGPVNGRGGTEYDYRKSAVRAHYLGEIQRGLERYAVDGLELNFTRNLACFPPDHPEECAPVLTQFIQDARRLLDKAGNGKRLPLALLVPAGIDGCRKQGLDLPACARLGLIDRVILSTPFLAVFDHDIEDARRKLPGVAVYAGCDRNLGFGFNGTGRVVPLQTYRAMALSAWRQGAAGIHLFNVMSWTMNHRKACDAVKRDGGQGETDGSAAPDYDRGLIHELGDRSRLERLDKLYVAAHGADQAHLGLLPLSTPEGAERSVRLFIGDDIARASAENALAGIWVQTVSPDCGDYNRYTLLLNGVDLSRQYAFVPHARQPDDPLLFPEPGRRGPRPPLPNVRRHAVNPSLLHTGWNTVTVKSYKGDLTVSEVEIAIRYAR